MLRWRSADGPIKVKETFTNGEDALIEKRSTIFQAFARDALLVRIASGICISGVDQGGVNQLP